MTQPSMQEPTFLILTALVDEARHGYAILEEVRRLSNGQVSLRAGTLYAALDRLRTDGLIALDREELVQSRLRRYYRITTTGAERLADETARLRRNAEAASSRLRRFNLRPAGGAA